MNRNESRAVRAAKQSNKLSKNFATEYGFCAILANRQLFAILMIMLAIFSCRAQVTTLTFVGKDRTGQDYVKLDSVLVLDQTQLWHEVLYYPDTTLRMGVVGIEEQTGTSFKLMQNVPNPFEGVTDFALSLPSGQDVALEIFDMNGKQVAGQQFGALAQGTHLFRATMNAPQTYLLSASTHDGKTSIKMINTGDGGGNNIVYLGMANADGGLTIQLKEGRGTTPYPFNYGDRMQYTGYATIDATKRVSDIVEKNQYNDETINLRFDVAKPTVTTHASSNIYASSATMNGEVTADNNALVTERGFCYRAGTTAPPTIADNIVVADSGLGSYSATATDLLPGTIYRVRAYAQNAVGVAYGQSMSLVTADTLPVVTTTQPSDIAVTTFTCGGNVMSANCSGTIYRGVCWNATGQPTVADAHTEDGTGVGIFTSNVTVLEPATTYHVRAYATNSAGTAYGEEYSVTTLCDLPIVTTVEISDIASRTADGGGEVTNEHGSPVTARGICWNTTGTPTTAAAHTTDGTGLGVFSSSLDSILPATTYYVRAYATNAIGTAYGAQVTFTTLCDVPELATTPASNVTATSFVSGGNVTAANCTDEVTRGVCWNTTGTPTVADAHTSDGVGAGSFASSVTGLDCNTTYYVRAYATNSVGTAYGEEYSVTTLASSVPELATHSVVLYNCFGLVASAEVLSDNCESVTARGFCYSTTANPTINDAHTTNGNGWGTFSDTITGLDINTTYYVRAYATNGVDTAYGEELSVTTCDLPTVTTSNVTDITGVSATCGGNVTSDGGATVTARGVCWSTSQNPTVSGSHTIDGTGTGSFTSSITGLTAGTTYYVRAYATNATGTAYGNQQSITTADCPSTLTDVDGNTYNTVWIGTQCWMKENLRTTKKPNGTSISSGIWTPGSNSVTTYGRLYSWGTVMNGAPSSNATPSGVQGICPTGWHVPSDAEWTQLTDYVSSQSEYVCGSNNTYIAKALAGTTGWSSSTYTCAVGNTPSQNNATGFSALPAGYYTSSHGGFGLNAYFWSATEYSSDRAYYRGLNYANAGVNRFNGTKSYGFSVRCVRDASGSATVSLPTVTTSNVTNITQTSATCGGNVTADGGATVTARGVCWSTSHNPVFNDSHVSGGDGLGSFSCLLTGLTPNTTYYARAYAVNTSGTAYGNEVEFTTATYGQPCPGTPTLTDVDGNTYNTVQIGNQCWMKENLRTTKYANGTSISSGIWTQGSNSVDTHGRLYSWTNVMNGAPSSSANPSGVQGICPTGWHVPSDAEWTQLTHYVSSQSQYCCSGNTSNIAKALASTTGWNSSSTTCAVGNTPSSNNATGFSALPAGTYGSIYGNFGGNATFWSATERSSDDAYYRSLTCTGAGVGRFYGTKSDGYSVRCVCD